MKQSLMLFAALIGGILSAWKNLTASYASAPSTSRSRSRWIKSNPRRHPAKLKQIGGG
jgi:hypothetical protein